jgi:hypothetical protein
MSIDENDSFLADYFFFCFPLPFLVFSSFREFLLQGALLKQIHRFMIAMIF